MLATIVCIIASRVVECSYLFGLVAPKYNQNRQSMKNS